MTTRYIAVETLEQAGRLLGGDGVRIIAGGTDLMVQLRRSRLTLSGLPEALVDVTRIPELNRLEIDGDRAYLGAAVTFRRLETDPEVARGLPLLFQTAATVGSVQIRQAATLGGNVANASPAADGLTALAALGARVEIASRRGIRHLELENLVTAPNRTVLEPDELIVGFELDRPPAPSGQTFHKVGRRRAVTIARLNVAVCLDWDLSDPRVVLGACFPTPRRLSLVEKMIAGGSPGPALWEEAGRLAAEQFALVCGWRPSATYKVPAAARVVARALGTAWHKVGGEA
ncbi:MAG: FAD binding domain-containing protein [Thermodesulfobacteriota bacterium]